MAKIKPVRVNLSTPAEEIIATMRAEIPVALYHFRKPYGGRRNYEVAEDKLLDKALADKQSIMTHINEYISPVGNRWMTYTMVDYYKNALYANATHISFIYYETYGSCGAFFPLYNPKNIIKKRGKEQADGVLIFTSHFFLRMSERTGKAYRSRELIQEFISTKSTQSSQTDEDGEVVVKFKGGYGFGVEKSQHPRVVEVRTYLTDKQLSPKQRNKVQAVDAYADIVGEGMYLPEVALGTALNDLANPGKLESESLKRMKALEKFGMDKHVDYMANITMGYVRLLEDILHIKVTEQQNILILMYATECGIGELTKEYLDFNNDTATEEDNLRIMSDTIDLYCRIARKMELKSVNRETITKRMKEIMAE